MSVPVAAARPKRHGLSALTPSHCRLAARRAPSPEPITFSASMKSMPPTFPNRRASSARADARAGSPSSAAHIASASFHTDWRECDGSISGQRPARSEVASAVRAATSIIRGV